MSDVAAFSPEEFRNRLEKFRAVMARHDLELVLIDRAEYLAWLTGYDATGTRYRALLVSSGNDPVQVDRTLDSAPYLEMSPYQDYVAVSDADDMLDAVVATIRERGWAFDRLGFDAGSQNMNVAMFRRLESMLPDTEFVDIADEIEALRWIKSPAEIELLGRISAIADAAMAEAILSTGEGKTERDASVVVASAFARLGADRGDSPITAGRGWNFLHGHTHNRPLEEGDVLHLELVPTIAGYSARLMRNCVIGEPSAEQIAVADRLFELQNRQLATMKPGARACDIDAIVREPVLAEGLRETFDNVSGYTLGYYPRFTTIASDFSRCFLPNSDWVLEEGMTFHMYLSARGLAVSESVVVRPDGAERLTRIEQRLFHT